MQKAVYRYDQNTDAQYQIAAMEVAYGHVSIGQFKQRCLLGVPGQVGWHLPEECLEMGHAIREMMAPGSELQPALSGIVELDEKYLGGKPRFEHGIEPKRGRGTKKQ